MALDEAKVRARVETDLDSATVERILNSATKAVERSAGAATAITVMFRALGVSHLPLSRPASAISAIRERASITSDEVTLSSDDYRLVGSYRILRLGSGSNPASYWGAEVEVDYTPEVDTDVRERVILDLCQMDIEFRAQDSAEDGASKETQKDYRARRKALLAQVREGRSPVL